MPATGTANSEKILQVFLLRLALFSSVLLIVFSTHFLRRASAYPITSLTNLGACGLASLIPIFFGWLSFKRIGMIFFTALATAGSILTVFVTGEKWFIFFPCVFITFAFLIHFFDQGERAEIVVREVEIDKQIAEKNDLELVYKEKGKNISVCFEKYSAYYNLRRLADEFSSTLDLTKLGDLIVTRTLEFILKGDHCLLFLASAERDEISLIASKGIELQKKPKEKLGDLFDYWVLRNRQHLIVSDTHKDFRFDLKKVSNLDVRSVILSPLIYAGRVAGTLRVDSKAPETFGTDHLRLLDAISTLASSAISNAMLYQKTVELAIRDSLTGLYVQRHFLERLKEEIKRALLTHSPLSFLMCDLDYFKKVNDQHGHAVGDLVLLRVAEVLKELCEHGIIARYGGEEFTVILPHIDIVEARKFAEKLRARIAKEKIDIRREIISITISIGVACLPDDTLVGEELIRLADERLYQAKRAGRNRVC